MTGRPEANLDWNKIDHLLQAGCLATEIAGYFGVCRETLYRRCESDKNVTFSTYSQEKRAKGDSLLRIKQYDLAMKGDKTLLVWLGKQRLGQQEESSIKQSINVNVIDYSKCDPTSQIPSEELSTGSLEESGFGD